MKALWYLVGGVCGLVGGLMSIAGAEQTAFGSVPLGSVSMMTGILLLVLYTPSCFQWARVSPIGIQPYRLWYFVGGVCGLVGALMGIGGAEQIAFGSVPLGSVSMLVGILLLVLGTWKCFQRARVSLRGVSPGKPASFPDAPSSD